MNQIVQLMVGVLNRGGSGLAVDIDGLNYWVAKVNSGSMSIANVAEAMLTSSEGRSLFATATTPHLFVDQLYRQILKRPLASDDTFFESRLASADTPSARAQVAVAVVAAVEAQIKADSTELGLVADFKNKVAAAIRPVRLLASAAHKASCRPPIPPSTMPRPR